MSACPCGSGRPIDACCGPHLSGATLPPTAEALMRSRYAAYATGAVDYLEQTLLPETRGDFDREQTVNWSSTSEWTGLEVRATEKGGAADEEGWVEFVARFRTGGKDYVHHETSRFVRRDGRWFYADGIIGTKPRSAAKVGRNDPCPCGSGRKYKKCCGA
ncbi:YchJ family protein [Rhodocista pekingensis]|uniref:YchJ family protein n=1 Tax=Rhodocista pekingensis TaxID=201185 RepID=A0ABW2KRE6_9PROT